MRLSDFNYDLPDDRIARYPLAARDQSRLLHYEEGQISHRHFFELDELLPSGSLMVFNDTRVIPARAIMSKPTGARIELLLLQPEYPTRIVSEAMAIAGSCTWECMIGNKKRWKEGEELKTQLEIQGQPVEFRATWFDREKNLVSFTWDGGYPFVDIVVAVGEIPLPPYLGREADPTDKETYQTVYAQQNGAVAAPTAGLHFTDALLERLGSKGIDTGFVTLHVGAGTFQPIKTEDVREHDMHTEQVVFTREFLNKLLANQGKLIAVGTTSLRSLESLYWYGVKCIYETDPVFYIEKDYPYTFHMPENVSSREAIEAILRVMEQRGQEILFGETRIFVTPGYLFRMVDGLVTNFHQPGSTLILLIAAFIGNDWRKLYKEALDNGYRFLSYGDSSLLWGQKKAL